MNNGDKKLNFKIFDKLKKIKHIEVYIAVIFICILLIIYLSNFKSSSSSKNNKTTVNELSVTAYIDNLETNLEEILSNIKGVSNVKVMITLDMGQLSVTNSMIELSEFPNIKGVIVTAKGVSDTYTKLKVLNAVEAVIDITNGNIEILSSD